MTAQDIDLREFSSDDLKKLRETISSTRNKTTSIKVFFFIFSY